MNKRLVLPTLVVLMLSATQTFAFSLRVDLVSDYFDDPANQKTRAKYPFLDGKSPVHQGMTAKALNCGADGSPCALLQSQAGIQPGSIVDGVRWNDFPAIYLTHQSPWCNNRVLRLTDPKATSVDVTCYMQSLAYAKVRNGKFNDPIWAAKRPFVSRGHFGDLQFWHAMAPANQTAGETYDNIQMWMAFAFRVSLGEFDLNADITTIPVPGLAKFFQPGARRVGDLVDYRYNRDMKKAQGVALGQMLHIAQDSFAKCHAQRNESGRIVRYFNYSIEDSKKHSFFDTDPAQIEAATSGILSPQAFAQELLYLRAKSTDWASAKEDLHHLVETYFRPVNPYLHAGVIPECQ